MTSEQAEEWAAEEENIGESGEYSRPFFIVIIMMRNYL